MQNPTVYFLFTVNIFMSSACNKEAIKQYRKAQLENQNGKSRVRR